MIKVFYISLLFLSFSAACFSQENPFSPDTLRTDTAGVTRTDTLITDTARTAPSDIDAIINYQASDSAVFDFNDKKLYLYDNAQITYKDLKLNAGVIVMDQEEQTLEAIGIPDSAGTGTITQLPIMFQGEDKYEAARLTYNFRTRQGNVSMGYTEAEVGYYFGEKIKRVTEDVYFIKNGLYTTSLNREDPEYFFQSPKMKIIPNDKVIAQSVFLYIEGVPVFWIPFAVFPNKRGRTSGLITPTFGDDGTYGLYVSNFGYFLALSDYLDVNATVSYFTKGKVDLRSRLRYALKYNFRGSVEGGYSRIRLGEPNDLDRFTSDEWALNISHNQTLDPTTTLDGNLSFVSGKSYYDNATNNLEDLLRQNVISNLTLSKYWEGTPFSANLNYFREQNLQTGDVRERLPSFTFTNTETFPFSSDGGPITGAPVWEYLSYSYNLNFQNDRRKITLTAVSGADSVTRDSRLAARHFASINFSPRFEFINIRPFFNYTELWYNKSIIRLFNPADSSVTTSDITDFNAIRYYNTGVEFNTRLIGIFSPRIMNITGIRHTITPAITYRYSPGYGEDAAYFGSYRDENDNEIRYSLFEREAFGNAPQTEEQALSFNLGNVFEMKTRVNDTTENKFQLFNLNGGISYNFAADSLKFSELRTDFRTQIGGLLNIAGGASFNLYKFDETKLTRVNQFLWDVDGSLAQLTAFSINLSTNFNLNLTSNSQEVPKTDFIERDTVTKEGTVPKQDSIRVDDNQVQFSLPFSGGLNFNFSENRANPKNITKSSNVSGNISFNLTQKWKFTVSASYDLVNKQIAAPYITAYRDLNSWEMLFDWRPIGIYRAFRLEIRIKAPELRDIKVTKQSSNQGVFTDF